MSNYPQYKNIQKVSALNSTLKLLKDLFQRLKHFLGILLIDNLMRNIVVWYDKQHSSSCSQIEEGKRPKTDGLSENNESIAEVVSELKRTVFTLKSKERELIIQLETQKKNIGILSSENVSLMEEKRCLTLKINQLQVENSQLLKRCLPETDIPAMIYYAQGDTSGYYFRKITTIKTPHHIYKLTTHPSDKNSAVFEPVVDSNIKEILDNRNITLIACDIISIAPNSSCIVVREKGRAVHENNKWKVIYKAKVDLR